MTDREQHMSDPSAELTKRIKEEIGKHSYQAISFRRFMELSLYHPTWGYYCRPHHRFGKRGDFFTNVQVNRLFGQLLGQVFYQTVQQEMGTGRLALVEMGAGDGFLMKEIISFFRSKGLENVDFYIIERGEQKTDQVDPAVKWVSEITAVPHYPFSLIFSNELVDAFPVHRLYKNGNKIYEVYVVWDQQAATFNERMGDCSTAELTSYANRLAPLMQEGQYVEVNLDAKTWLKEIAQWLNKGYVYTIDYGGKTEDLLFRPKGTLRYYQQHRLLDHAYDQPGNVDMTAHVDFSQLISWGQQWGLQETFLGTQTRFFLNEANPMLTKPEQIHAWKQLVHPDGMGEVFQVLAQKKSTL